MTTHIYTLEKRTQNFLNKAKLFHNNFYDYSLVNYINSRIKVQIICPIHGIFEQSLLNHSNGSKCIKCSYKDRSLIRATNINQFIDISNNIHKNKYDYSLVNYINTYTKVQIICPIHGIFNQQPRTHIIGQGCKLCFCDSKKGRYNSTTLNRNSKLANKSSSLYMIEHDNLTKIGITTKTVQSRFYKKIKVIYQLDNISLIDSFTKEQQILKKYSSYLERPTNWNYTGNTEFLNITNKQQNQIIIDYFI